MNKQAIILNENDQITSLIQPQILDLDEELLFNSQFVVNKLGSTVIEDTFLTEQDRIHHLYSKVISISPNDWKINHEELESFIETGELQPISALSTSTTYLKRASLDIETHPIKQILERVLDVHPEIRSGQAWQVLRLDFNSEAQEYDVDGCIVEMTPDSLEYFGQGEMSKRLGKGRFKNILSEVRKKCHG